MPEGVGYRSAPEPERRRWVRERGGGYPGACPRRGAEAGGRWRRASSANPNLIFPGPTPVSMETAGSRNGNQNPEMRSLQLPFAFLDSRFPPPAAPGRPPGAACGVPTLLPPCRGVGLTRLGALRGRGGIRVLGALRHPCRVRGVRGCAGCARQRRAAGGGYRERGVPQAGGTAGRGYCRQAVPWAGATAGRGYRRQEVPRARGCCSQHHARASSDNICAHLCVEMVHEDGCAMEVPTGTGALWV